MYTFRNIVIQKRDNPYEARNKTDERYYRAFAEISNGELDTDGHIMGEDTLKNFARGAKAGVQVKDSHEYKNGFGKTFDGKYESGENRVVSGLRITRNMPLGDNKSYPISDSFITAIEDEIITQVSIGAYGGDLICNICDASMYGSRDCYHWPLCTYLIDTDGVKEQVVCTATYVGGKLREVSLVDKGATPGAEIIKQRLEDHIEKGIISDSQIYLVKSMYGVEDGIGFGYPSSGTVSSRDLKSLGMDKTGEPVGGDPDPADADYDSGTADVDNSGNSKNTGDDKVDIEKAKQEIDRLNKSLESRDDEIRKHKKDIAEKEDRIKELSHLEIELKGEKDSLKEEILPIWKENRGNKYTGDELKRYEDRLDRMDIWNLKEEKAQVEGIALLKKAADAKADDSGSDDGDSGDGDDKSAQGGGKDVKKSNRKTRQDPKKDVDDDDDDGDDGYDSPPSPAYDPYGLRGYPGIG